MGTQDRVAEQRMGLPRKQKEGEEEGREGVRKGGRREERRKDKKEILFHQLRPSFFPRARLRQIPEWTPCFATMQTLY